MKQKVFIWMCVLTALAGLINVLSIRLFAITVSHMTGVVSNAVVSSFEGDFSNAGWLLSLTGLFLLGAVISALITGERSFFIKPVYGYIVISIGVLISAGVHIFNLNGKIIVLLFAFLMGVQNGMIVSFKGVLVRMTHLTGYITDLGVYIGYKLRGKIKEDFWKGLIPFSGLVMFILGGVLGLWMFSKIGIVTYDIAALLYVFLGLLYLINEKKSDDRDMDGIPDSINSMNK